MALEAESSTTPSFGEMLTWALLQASGRTARHAAATTVPRSILEVERTRDGRIARVANAFDCLGKANPLRGLPFKDQELVWANLKCFQMRRQKKIGGLSKCMEELERIAKAASDAANLATTIEELLRNDCGEVLNRRLTGFGGLSTLLKSFASQVNGDGLLSLFGESRFKKKRALEDQFLIDASQLVWLNTGTWNDEPLAELLQSMGSNLDRDFSGEAIRRRRERFKKEHPELYDVTVRKVSRGHKKEGQQTGKSVAGKLMRGPRLRVTRTDAKRRASKRT